MKSVKLFILALMCSLLVATESQAKDVWKTTYGDLVGKHDDQLGFMGIYDSYPSGYVYLEHQGNGKYIGYWSQTSSEKKCRTGKRGRGYSMTAYWGRLEVQANKKGGFHGKWSYCNGRPSDTWSGTPK